VGAVALAVALGLPGRSLARGMMLTAAGTAEGFTISTFVDQFPTNPVVGPVGITFTTDGHVMVSSYAAGYNVVFTDQDNQHVSQGVPSVYHYFGSDPAGLTRTSNGSIYQALQQSGAVIQVDQAGNFSRVVAGGLGFATGITTNPNNDHLFVSFNGGIADVDPVHNTTSMFKSVGGADGLIADHNTLYAKVGSDILGYDLVTGNQVYDSGFILGADGAALGTGALAGNIFVNTNYGEIWEVTLGAHPVQTLIASGGSRGDLVNADPNGSLLLTQTDSVLRLTPGPGGGFGDPTAVPEPATVVSAAIGLATLAGYRLRRRKASTTA